MLFAGGLALLAAVGGQRFAWARYGWPGLFFLLGVFLFFRHDPESWPFGPLTFWESVTETQVLQHIVFTLIVLGIGIIEWMRCRGTLSHPAWGWIFPSLAVSAAIMLFMHKHWGRRGGGQGLPPSFHHGRLWRHRHDREGARRFTVIRQQDQQLCLDRPHHVCGLYAAHLFRISQSESERASEGKPCGRNLPVARAMTTRPMRS